VDARQADPFGAYPCRRSGQAAAAIEPRWQSQAATGQNAKHEPGTPKPKAQRNFTAPESRIMVSVAAVAHGGA
jgi:hypothetical protein